MSYLKYWGYVVATFLIIFTGIRVIILLVQFINKVCEYVMAHKDSIGDVLAVILGHEILVPTFLTLIIVSPLIAFFQWLIEEWLTDL